jgi:phage shock protein PspC (stress-responsive transcriptional regulator)
MELFPCLSQRGLWTSMLILYIILWLLLLYYEIFILDREDKK